MNELTSATTLIIRSGEFMNFTAINSHELTAQSVEHGTLNPRVVGSTPHWLAQSVEHGTLNPRVVGSSPTLGELYFAAAFLIQSI